MGYDEMQTALREYNWDDGFLFPQKLLDDPACDLALALEIFYLADGCAYLSGAWKESRLTQWKEFIDRLYWEILEGRYPETMNDFSVPLNRVAKHKYKRNGVPEVFLTDLPVISKPFQEAVNDSRRRENLIGPFSTAEKAIASMLES